MEAGQVIGGAVGELAARGKRAYESAQSTIGKYFEPKKRRGSKKKSGDDNAHPPPYNNSRNMSNNTQHGGPGAIISYKEGIRFATNTVFSTNYFYHARCLPPTWTDGDKNKSRQIGYGQPLYMEMVLDYNDDTGLPTPSLPLIGSANTLDRFEGHCFAIEWPGNRMHEDPDTNNVGKLSVFGKWLTLSSGALSKTQNVAFSSIMSNLQWKKLIVTNTFLRFDFTNFSVFDYKIHIITYTNKRKGIKYSEEFTQWINGFDDDTEADAIAAYDFYVNGKLLLPPPCKIIKHKSFLLKTAHLSTQTQSWDIFATGTNAGYGSAIKSAQRKSIRMKFKRGFTFKRDNLVTLPTDENTWLESTAVPEEQMTYVQIIAVPFSPTRLISQTQPKRPLEGTVFSKNVESSTAENITWIQNFNENYTANKIGDANNRIPIPGVQCVMRKKVYFCLDKDISI